MELISWKSACSCSGGVRLLYVCLSFHFVWMSCHRSRTWRASWSRACGNDHVSCSSSWTKTCSFRTCIYSRVCVALFSRYTLELCHASVKECHRTIFRGQETWLDFLFYSLCLFFHSNCCYHLIMYPFLRGPQSDSQNLFATPGSSGIMRGCCELWLLGWTGFADPPTL